MQLQVSPKVLNNRAPQQLPSRKSGSQHKSSSQQKSIAKRLNNNSQNLDISQLVSCQQPGKSIKISALRNIEAQRSDMSNYLPTETLPQNIAPATEANSKLRMVQNASPVKSINSERAMHVSNSKRSIKIHNALQHEDTHDNHTTYDDDGGFS